MVRLKRMEQQLPKVQMLPVSQLIPYVKNSKIHSDEQVTDLAKLIAKFGWDQPIVVDKDLCIIKGHARLLAAQKIGLDRVPVIVKDWLSEEEVIAERIADNKIADRASYDFEAMKFDLGTLQRADFNLELTAIPQFQIQQLLSDDSFQQADTSSEKSKTPKEITEDYDQSQSRQIVLVLGIEEFEEVMEGFADLQREWEVQTNVEVVLRLLREHYAAKNNPSSEA